jgi:DNA sulfur modification protein DndD
MFLKSLQFKNYGVFADTTFNLATDVDHPLVLMTGNNGAGKTTILEALRIALHGRRAFDSPLGEAEYLNKMAGRFGRGTGLARCSVTVLFDYVDQHVTRTVSVERAWSRRGKHVDESVLAIVDGQNLPADDAEDFLVTILPPEVARYFFFDGERIRELAEWGVDDEAALFQAVGDLLGLGLLDQLKIDLLRIMDQESKSKRASEDVTARLEEMRGEAQALAADLKSARVQTRRVRGVCDRARSAVRRLGALQSEEVSAAQEQLGSLLGERKALHEEFERSAHDILPLLCARSLRQRFSRELDIRLRIEEREIVNGFLDQHADEIRVALRSAKLKAQDVSSVVSALKQVARGKPLPVSLAFPHITRADAIWMQRIVEHELPELSERMRALQARLVEIDRDIRYTEERVRSAPSNDPAAEAALNDLEAAQRAYVEHETLVRSLEQRVSDANEIVENIEKIARANRQEAFRSGRLAVRGRMMQSVLDALPALTLRLQESKEQRFAAYLKSALNDLWHKTERLTDVRVSFSERHIELFDKTGPLEKADLSAGEKQLFAVGFIYALAQLSGARMPLVIDTPLGRLDKEHRRRFVAGFLPTASHQVIILSTDTEIVGALYEDVEPLLKHHYELSEFNGGVTEPVQLALA